jgi:hypothetical protein
MVPNDVASMMQQSLDSKSVTLDMQRHQDKYATGHVSQCGLFCGELKPKITIYIDHPIALKVSNAANLVSVDAQLERLVVGNGIAFYGGPNRDIRATRDIKNLELTIDEMLIVDLGKAHILNARLIYASRDAPQVRMGVVDKLTVIRPDTENVCVTNVATTLPLQLIAASIGSMEIDGNDVTQKVAQAWLNPPLLTQSSYSSTCYLVAPSM